MSANHARQFGVLSAGFIALTLFGLGAFALAHRPRTHPADDVQEAVFRDLMQHYPLDAYHRVYFISTVGAADPSPAFLRRFGAVPVVPSSRMEAGMYMGYSALLDKQTGRKGWGLFVDEIRWGTWTDSADVQGGWENTRSGGNIDTFHVVRSGGKWRVTSSKTWAQM